LSTPNRIIYLCKYIFSLFRLSVNDLFHIQYRTTAHTYKITKIPPNPSEGLFVLLLSILLIGTLCEMHVLSGKIKRSRLQM